MRQLHRDLDRAASALPERGFLRRYRADRAALVRQESEWVLASRIFIRGAYARSIIERTCVSAELLPLPGPAAAPRAHRRGRAVLLAGLAAARNGVDAALAACASLGLELRGRTGEGSEPGVVPARGFDDIGVVVAPAWCESYSPELATARALAIPVIATRAAAGFEPVIEVPAGDPVALASAIDRALAGQGSDSDPVDTVVSTTSVGLATGAVDTTVSTKSSPEGSLLEDGRGAGQERIRRR